MYIFILRGEMIFVVVILVVCSKRGNTFLVCYISFAPLTNDGFVPAR